MPNLFGQTQRALSEGSLYRYEYAALTKIGVKLEAVGRVNSWIIKIKPIKVNFTPELVASYVREYMQLIASEGKVSSRFSHDLREVLDDLNLPAPRTRAFLQRPSKFDPAMATELANLLQKAFAGKASQPVASVARGPVPSDAIAVEFEKGVAFTVPIKGARVSSVVGPRVLQGRKSYHYGIDFSAPVGTPFFAADDGTLTVHNQPGGFGEFGLLQATNAVYVYAHAKPGSLKPGKYQLGQRIGEVGNSGHSTGPHLHFEIRHLPGGRRLSTKEDAAQTAKLLSIHNLKVGTNV